MFDALLTKGLGKIKKATKATRAPGPSCRNSFTGDTPVLLSDATQVPISQIEEGDQVVATDPETGVTGPRTVVATIIGDGDKDLVTVATGDGESLTATSNHPIWEVSSQTWVDAGDLWPGDILETVSGDHTAVVALTYQTVTTVVYNLTVEDIHTYHVGHNEILVHNCGRRQSSDLDWDPSSRPTFGHTISDHGAHPRTTRSIEGRAGGTGNPVGQWLDNDAAADFLRRVYDPDAGPRTVPIPDGMGRVVQPDGSSIPATHATLVPRPGGGYRTAYPVVGGSWR